MPDQQELLANQVDLIHVNCGAHFKVLDEDTKNHSLLMQCIACESLMIVSKFMPQKQRAKPDPIPTPDELDTRSDQEIQEEVAQHPTGPQTSTDNVENSSL